MYREKSVIVKATHTGEIDCLQKSPHKNIVELIGAIPTLGEFGIQAVMKYMPENLGGFLVKHRGKSTVDWTMRFHIAIEICEGLRYLHENKIIHRDIKPLNILLDEATMSVVIADFGEAIMFDNNDNINEEKSRPMCSFTTPQYVAWELVGRNPTYSAKVDIFALAITLYCLATHDGPWRYTSPLFSYDFLTSGILSYLLGQFPSGTPASYVQTVMGMWHQNPTLRPTAEEALQQLKDGKDAAKKNNVR